MTQRNEPCWCGSGKKWKHCHFPKETPSEAAPSSDLRELYKRKYGILIKNEKEIAGIRAACRLTSEILAKTCAMAKEGVTTIELNDYAHKLHIEAGAIPACLHYGEPPFPASICTSFNEVICHGIPDKTPLRNGDIINIDLSAILNGYYGDCSRMIMVGDVSDEKRLVVEVSHESLLRAMTCLKPGTPISEIGDIIESYATSRGCSVVNQFVAHGVGIGFHENPQVPHHRNKIHIPMAPGMTFTIEPMINAGVREAVIDKNDMWTARTRDGRPSAQWEHTFLITDTSYEVLTSWNP